MHGQNSSGDANKLNTEVEDPELQTELLKAVNGPHRPFRKKELREIASRALQSHRNAIRSSSH